MFKNIHALSIFYFLFSLLFISFLFGIVFNTFDTSINIWLIVCGIIGMCRSSIIYDAMIELAEKKNTKFTPLFSIKLHRAIGLIGGFFF